MDTKAFLEEILPSEGYIVLAEFKTNPDNGSKYIVHHFFEDADAAAKAALAMDARGSDVYHGCATYITNESRKQANVSQAKCFWLDIDVGKENSYATKKEAVEALADVCKKLQAPMPLIISSGRGLHCYWVFDHAVTATAWKSAVLRLRTALDQMGFLHDPARTTDQASILRPVGTTWRKAGDKPVTVAHKGGKVVFEEFISNVDKYLAQAGVMAAAPKKVFEIFQVERLTQKPEYPPSSAINIANLCPQLARMRDMRGAIAEPEWRNAIGVIKHTVEGEELCHEWSKGDPRYDEAQTQEKIDRWETGPTTCETFASVNPHVCSGCKYKDKVTSPIQLGYVAQVEAPELEQPKDVATETVDYMQYWPDGFQWDSGRSRLQRLVQGKDEIPYWDDFCDTLFYPTSRVQQEDGTYAMRYTMQVSKNKWRQFEIPTKLLTSTEGFSAALASFEVIIYPKKGHHAMAYTSSWLEKFKQTGVEINTYKHYGWHDNYEAFLFGDRLMRKDGSESTIIRATSITAGSRLDTDFRNFTHQGSAKEWAGIFNDIYNRPGAEPYMFASLALMASPLVALFEVDDWNGIPVAFTGDGGQGKTSVGMAACSIYGRGKSFVFDTKNSTMNAFDPFVAAMGNLPCVLDELTGREPIQMSDKLYALSNGGGRDRADQKGNLSAVRHSWKLISLITGNTNITESMHRLEKQRADASAVRIFEVTITAENGAKLFHGINVQEMLSRLHEHYGLIGRQFVKLSMFERAKLREAFLNLRRKLGYESTSYDTRERFYIDLIATAHIGGIILKNMGYIQFDLKRVQEWAMNHINELRVMRAESFYTADDQLASFFATLVGHMIYTKDISRTVVEAPMDNHRLTGDIKARIATNARRVIVSSRAMDEWCAKANIPPRIFRKQLRELGYIKANAPEKFTLGSGTNIPSVQERVVEFEYDKVINAADKVSESAKVVQLR